MPESKKNHMLSIRGALARFRLECAKEIEILDRIEKNNKNSYAPRDGNGGGRSEND